MDERKATMKYATCHPDNKRMTSDGLCKSCYDKKRYGLVQDKKREASLESKKRAKFNNPRALYFKNLEYLYGITEEEYNGLYEAQNKTCAICKIQFPPTKLVVDHIHGTQNVRGLLCTRCNLSLGLLNSKWGLDAQEYLREKGAEHYIDDAEKHLKEVINPTWNFAKRAKTRDEEKLNAVIGLGGEVGEVLDIIKKERFHEPKDRSSEFLSELGDATYYLLKVMDLYNLSFRKVLDYNRKKLESRHPELGIVTERFGKEAIKG